MKDPKHTASWSDTLTLRVQYQESRTPLEDRKARLPSTAAGLVCGPPVTNQPFQPVVTSGDDLEHFDSDGFPKDCEVMRFSPSDLTTLRSIPPTSLVLLLTPVMTPVMAKKAGTTSESTDPFEFFGRELSKLHHRLRHVPYVPKVGLTKTHASFIEQAAAIIVVNCEPIDSDSQSLASQYDFAKAVLKEKLDYESECEDEDEVPLVLLRFGPNGEESDDDDDDDCSGEHSHRNMRFSNVLYASNPTKSNVTKAARLLFKA